MDIVFVKHNTEKEYCFYVPFELIPYIKKGVPVLVETKRGLSMGTVTTDIISGDGVVDIATRYGATFPLRPVISIVDSNIANYVESKLAKDIKDKLPSIMRKNIKKMTTL